MAETPWGFFLFDPSSGSRITQLQSFRYFESHFVTLTLMNLRLIACESQAD